MLLMTKAMIFLHMFIGVILIGIILLQRGRGGGLAGAFGGMGGQSAFGTKAGDIFTRITIVLAAIWIVLGGLCILAANSSASVRYQGGTAADVKKAPAKDGESEKEDSPDSSKPGATKTGDKKNEEKKDAEATEGAKPAASKSEGQSSSEGASKNEDKGSDLKGETVDGKDADGPASPNPPKKPEAAEDAKQGGAVPPDKPAEKVPD